MSARALVIAACIVCGVAVAAQSQRDTQAPRRDRSAVVPTGTGVVAGVVMSTGERPQPVRRASVMLASGVVVVPRTAMTDDEGRFEFTGLSAGNYTLVAQKSAWVPAVYGARSATDTQGIPIAVADGQRVAVRMSMVRGGVVAGTIRMASGAPAIGVAIQAMRVRVVDGRRQASIAAAPAQTDDQGSYRIFGLPAGDYVLQARSQMAMFMSQNTSTRQVTEAEVRWADAQLAQAKAQAVTTAAAPPEGAPPAAGPSVTYSAVYFPGTAFMSDAAIVSVQPGLERGNVDFALTPVPTGRVTGLVLLPDGAPAAGATVSLEGEGGSDGDVFALIAGPGRGSTGRDGRFSLQGVTPGQYTLNVRATPRQPGTPEPSPGMSEMAEALAMVSAMTSMFGGGTENPATLFATDSVAVNGQDVGPLTLQLRDGLSIEGTVVTDAGGPPPDVTAMRIGIAKPTSGEPIAAMMSRMMGTSIGTPGADGAFRVRGLVPGKYAVTVTGKSMRVNTIIPGIPPAKTGWVVKSIKWRDQDLADTGVEVLSSGPLTGVVVTITDRPSELSGTVTDLAGRPTGTFPIVVYAADRTRWGAGSRRVTQAQPASDGKFTVIGLPAGEYYVAAVTRLEPGDLENRQFLEDLIPSAIRLSIADGEKKTQDLKLASGG